VPGNNLISWTEIETDYVITWFNFLLQNHDLLTKFHLNYIKNPRVPEAFFQHLKIPNLLSLLYPQI